MSYSMSELIIKKRDGGRLAADEIAWFVRGYTDGMIPDYQAGSVQHPSKLQQDNA